MSFGRRSVWTQIVSVSIDVNTGVTDGDGGVCELSWQVEAPSGQPSHDEKRKTGYARVANVWPSTRMVVAGAIAVTELADWGDWDSGFKLCRIWTLEPLKARKVRRKGKHGLDLILVIQGKSRFSGASDNL